MRVLMLSIDNKIFEEGSEVRSWMVEYGRLVEELHIIVYTKVYIKVRTKFQISNNVFVYPTNTRFRPFYFWQGYKIARKILDKDFLITSQEAMTNLLALILKWRFGIKFQAQIHTDFTSPFFRKESFKNFLRYIAYRFSIRYADCIRTVSKRILARLNLTSFVLPIWVDVEKIKNAPIRIDPSGSRAGLHEKYPQFDFIILMASRLTKEKNIGLAIDVIKDFPGVGLVIVGEGPEKENLMLQASRFKLHENIIFEKWTDDLISYYKTCDLFLLTSNYEGYGRTLIEAAAAGCKIISSDVGIANEILEKESVFKVGDGEDLKKKVELAIQGLAKPPKPIPIKTKEEYLREYKRGWMSC